MILKYLTLFLNYLPLIEKGVAALYHAYLKNKYAVDADSLKNAEIKARKGDVSDLQKLLGKRK